MRWRSIRTVPKSCVETVILDLGYGWVSAGRWLDNPPPHTKPNSRYKGGCWNIGQDVYFYADPIRWMPFPKPFSKATLRLSPDFSKPLPPPPSEGEMK